MLLLLIFNYTIVFSQDKINIPIINTIPYSYTITFTPDSIDNISTTDTLYTGSTLLAEYVYPRANGFASFEQ
jgi:hypothetical protein